MGAHGLLLAFSLAISSLPVSVAYIMLGKALVPRLGFQVAAPASRLMLRESCTVRGGMGPAKCTMPRRPFSARGLCTVATVTADVPISDVAADVSGYQPKSAFIKVMKERGFLHSCTNIEELDKKMAEGTVSAYLGFDATASSLHVGSLLQIMILRHLQKSGHKPIVLLGGGTTKVGDPTGKDTSRKMLSNEDIAKNMNGIKTAFDKFLTFGDGKTDAIMVNNDDWLSGLKCASIPPSIHPSIPRSFVGHLTDGGEVGSGHLALHPPQTPPPSLHQPSTLDPTRGAEEGREGVILTLLEGGEGG